VVLRQPVRFKRELCVDGGNRNGPTETPPTYGPMIALRSPRKGWTERRKGSRVLVFLCGTAGSPAGANSPPLPPPNTLNPTRNVLNTSPTAWRM